MEEIYIIVLNYFSYHLNGVYTDKKGDGWRVLTRKVKSIEEEGVLQVIHTGVLNYCGIGLSPSW